MQPVFSLEEPQLIPVLSDYLNQNPGELLLGWDKTSILGRLSDADVLALLAEYGPRCILLWDAVENQSGLDRVNLLEPLCRAGLTRVRAADPGVLRCLVQHYPQLELEADLRVGNHNRDGLARWKAQFPQLRRMALGVEWPLDEVASLTELAIDLEYPALGPILIFHSPRPLIQTHLESQESYWEGQVQADEKHHALTVIENQRGTHLLYNKWLFLLDQLEAMKQAGVAFMGLSLFGISEPQRLLHAIRNEHADWAALRKSLGHPTTRGFSKSNRTDKQFKHLNPRRRKQEAMGLVLDTKSGIYMVLECRDRVREGQILHFQIPEGDWLEAPITRLRLWTGEPVDQVQGGCFLACHVPRVSAGSLVFSEAPDGNVPGPDSDPAV